MGEIPQWNPSNLIFSIGIRQRNGASLSRLLIFRHWFVTCWRDVCLLSILTILRLSTFSVISFVSQKKRRLRAGNPSQSLFLIEQLRKFETRIPPRSHIAFVNAFVAMPSDTAFASAFVLPCLTTFVARYEGTKSGFSYSNHWMSCSSVEIYFCHRRSWLVSNGVSLAFSSSTGRVGGILSLITLGRLV